MRQGRGESTAPADAFVASDPNHCLIHIRILRIVFSMNFLFVETSHFTSHVTEYLTDDEYRRFQWFLIENPDSGAVVSGTGGIRKIRWSMAGRGKRGGFE